MSWTLDSTDTPDDISDSIEDGVYSLFRTSDCHLKSTRYGSRLRSVILFLVHRPSPCFSQYLPPYIGPDSRYHPGATETLVKDGRAHVSRSHDIPITATQAAVDEQAGKLFGREHEILIVLNIGSSFFFGVADCTQDVVFICRKGTSLLYPLVLVSRNGNYMAIPDAW